MSYLSGIPIGALIAATLSVGAPAVLAQEPTRGSDVSAETMRPEITGRFGVVAAGRHFAVAAGVRTLEKGGNAIDAGVAAVFAAAVTEFSHFGFGGEAPTIVYDAEKDSVVVINGQGTAPRAVAPGLFKKRGYIDQNGPLAATVPAVLDAMAIALQFFGTLSLEQVMAPALEYADGFAMYGMLRGSLARERAATERWDWSRKTYYPDGRVPEIGEIFRQPGLAATFRRIIAAERENYLRTEDRIAAIQAGRDEFYKGDTARRIAAAMHEAGGVMDYEDLAAYQGRMEDPVSTTFDAYEIYKPTTWDQGPVLLQTLNILEGLDLAAAGWNSADYVHTVHEALKLAFADRNAFYGDPYFTAVPITGLLSKEYGRSRRRLIGPEASLEHRPGDPFEFDPEVKRPRGRYRPHPQGRLESDGGDTTAIEVVDRRGNLFSATPSSGWLLGGAFVAGDTGVPMSNRMTVFDLDPKSPNHLAGGKRPRTTLSPTIVFKDHKPYLAIGTPGGDSQDQQILNVLLNLIVFRMPAQQAIEAPRFNSKHFHGSFADHRDHPGVLEVEDRIPAATLAELRARGHKLEILGPYGVTAGVVLVGINQEQNTLFGAADPRRERYVFGW